VRHNIQNLPRWAQRRILLAESQNNALMARQKELSEIIRNVGERPFSTTWSSEERLYIAAVKPGFTQKLKTIMAAITG